MAEEKCEWISITEAAALAGVTKSVIYYHVPRDHFRTLRTGTVWLVHKESLLEFYDKEAKEQTERGKGETALVRSG